MAERDCGILEETEEEEEGGEEEEKGETDNCGYFPCD
jgi:hypothetical protein